MPIFNKELPCAVQGTSIPGEPALGHGDPVPCVHPSPQLSFPQPPHFTGRNCQQPVPRLVRACDVLLSLLGTSSSMAPAATCMYSVPVGGGLEQGVSKIRSYGRSKVCGWEWRGEMCGRRLVAQLVAERSWPLYACRSHVLTQRLGVLHSPAPTDTFQPSRPCSAEGLGNRRCYWDVSRAALRGSGRGFIPRCGSGGEPFLGGVCVLHSGTTVRAELSVTVTLLGRLRRMGQTTTTSTPACPACPACPAWCEGGSWEHRAL